MSKLFRLILINILLLGLFSVPVQAQKDSQGGNFVYAALITQLDPQVPLYVQAQQAFERLQPQLLEAKRQGQILNFEPDFSGGLVKIELASGASTLSINDSPLTFSDIHSAAQVVAGQKKQLKAQSLADVSPSAVAMHNVYLGSSCFDASYPLPYAHLVASLRDSAGNIVSTSEGDADNTGYIWDCFNGVGLATGYKANFRWYSSTGTYLNLYTVTAPKITFSGLDKVNSIARGTAPAGKPFDIYWWHPLLNSTDTGIDGGSWGLVPSTGAWAIDFGTVPFRGGDYLNMRIKYTNFFVRREFSVPYANCYTGAERGCTIDGYPGTAVSASIKHAGVTHDFAGKFNSSNSFYAEPRKADGSPIFLSAGDTITATGVAAWLIPSLTANINYSTDVISGKAPASKYFQISVRDSNWNWYGKWVHSDAMGNYATSFASQINLLSTSAYAVEVNYINPGTGNGTRFVKKLVP